MSGKHRTAGPVRQLSLQQQQQSPLVRRVLRRQLSEEQSLCVTACSIKNGPPSEEILAAPSRPITSVVRPRPVKVAWAERRQLSQQQDVQTGVEVVARRCPGQPRPISNLPSITAERDSILYTRQELAERLRRAWKEREQGRPNLDIFLAHNSIGSEEETTPRPSSSLSAPNMVGNLSPTVPRSTHALSHKGSPLHSVSTAESLSRRQNAPALPVTFIDTATNVIITPALPSNNLLDTAASNATNSSDRIVPTTASTAAVPVPRMRLDNGIMNNVTGAGANNANSNNTKTAPHSVTVEATHNHPKGNKNKPHAHTKTSMHKPTPELHTRTVANVKQDTAEVLDNTANRSIRVSDCLASSAKDNSDSKSNMEQLSQNNIMKEISSEERTAKPVAACDEINNTNTDGDMTPRIVVAVPPIENSAAPNAKSTNECIPKEEETICDNAVRKVTNEVAQDKHNVAPSIPAAVRRVNFKHSSHNKTLADRPQTGLPASNHPPPLTRALSAPAHRNTFGEQGMAKGILVKSSANECIPESDGEEDILITLRERNIKSATVRRRLKSAFSRRKLKGREDSSDDDAGQTQVKKEEKEKSKSSSNRGNRRGLMRGAEVVTMVSLMSPTGSDCDDDSPDTFLQPPVEGEPSWMDSREDGRNSNRPRDDRTNVPAAPSRIVCLRKSPKSVSFQQQPSISTSFPSRRGSLIIPPDRDRRPPPTLNPVPVSTDTRRRIPRIKNTAPFKGVECVQSTEADSVEEGLPKENKEEIIDHTSQDDDRNESVIQTDSPSVKNEIITQVSKEEYSPQEPEFQTPKERECWYLYRRMCEKGVCVSYDTILRGMLTPTEYRLHRSAAPSTC